MTASPSDAPAHTIHHATHQPDPTLSSHAAQGGLSAPHASPAAELSRLTLRLKSALRQFPDFPSPGILFEDILPIFADPELHQRLVRALELAVVQQFGGAKPDIVVGLDARGFLFGPSLALRLNAGFVPVRKRGKLPGPCETAEFVKEYGSDFFQMQQGAIQSGQKVLIVDDIIATGTCSSSPVSARLDPALPVRFQPKANTDHEPGGSASAAGSLVKKLGGTTIGYLFILELDFLKGRDKLDAPVHTLLTGQEEKLQQ